MAAIGQTKFQRGTYTTSTTAETGYCGPTDTSSLPWFDDEYTKTDVEEKFDRQIRKEELQIPDFKVVRKLHNTMKISSFAMKQPNFNIRNAL